MTRAKAGGNEVVRHGRIGPSPRLLLLCALPLSLMIVAIVVDQFWRQQKTLLTELERVMNEQHHALGTLVAENDQQLARMRLTMVDGIAGMEGLSRMRAGEFNPVSVKLPSAEVNGLEWAPGAHNAALGSIFTIPDIATKPPDAIGPMDAAINLLSSLHIDRKAGSSSHSSYFLSAQADFVAVYPGLSLRAIAWASGVEHSIRSLGDLFASLLGSDVYKLGLPQNNTNRQPYWTKPYVDAAGFGMLISHAAPVYLGDRFYGVVGTDLRLESFDAVIARMPQPLGLLAVATDKGDILSINGRAFNGDRAKMTDYLRKTGALGPKPLGNIRVGFEETASDWVRIQASSASPFRLVYVLPKTDLNAYLLPRFAPYALILLGLGATLLGIFYLLHRTYIAPSFKLAEYLTLQAAGVETTIPPLPAGWRKHFLTIAGIVSTMHRYQARLEQSEARLLAATSSLSDGFAIADAEGKLVFFNDAFAGHLAGDKQADVAAGVDIASLIDLEKFNVDGTEVEYELADGRWIDGWLNAMPDGGKVILLHDITDTKRTELQIRESEARYRLVINTQTEMVARHDPSGHTTFANDAYCRYLSLSLDELLNREISDFDTIFPDDREMHEAHLASLTPESPTATIVIRNVLMPSGDIRWEEWTDTGIFDGDGRLIEIQAIGRDITEKVRAEEALSVSEARMAAFLEHAPVAMLAKDRNGIFTLVNPETVKRLGRPAHEIIGKRTIDILPAAEAAMMDRSIEQVMETGEVQIEEQYHPSLDPFLYSMFIRFPVRAENGEITGTGVFAVDQTSQRLVELELEKQRGALHQSEKMAALGSLLAGVAHELNNPLSIVVGYSGMLHEMAKDEATKRRTKELHAAAERCARIVKTFLSMARSKPIEKRNVSVDTVMDDVLELAAYGLRSNGINVIRERLVTLPEFFADPDQLHQVFMNVVLNAQQAMSGIDGERKLNVKSYRGRGHIVVDILDTGPGIDDATRARAFEPFFTTKPQGVGTGIGLSVCLRIVEAHGGLISLDAAPGGGTLCRIKFPMSLDVPKFGDAETVTDFRLSGKLLVVDDEAAIGEFLVDALGAEGVEVTAATSGREAQQMVMRQDFDAILTDLRMPGIDGGKLVDFILKKRPHLEGRIVVMTGDALNAQNRPERVDLPLVTKPIDLALLRAALRPLLNQETTAAEEAATRIAHGGVN
ncbi:PAS domain S-box protein [Rhizobium sp. KVB221]|uniref:histidine kinase n=1 Tax=Rhizobium setariae TaxID=2801340 RepID=A0A937CPY7_9HYPH|nr:PAS domain S-box protein [Rhizobium setariae]MBL0373749.1 PAS domain S-box protein [Rhizobium setariae]